MYTTPFAYSSAERLFCAALLNVITPLTESHVFPGMEALMVTGLSDMSFPVTRSNLCNP